MAATSFDLRDVDLLQLLAPKTNLKKAAATDGGEFHGPCPWCGGKDRFMVWPFREHPGYNCRQCGHSGDAIDYVVETEGLTFEQAVERLELRDPTRAKNGQPKVPEVRTTTYPIRDAEGREICSHVRIEYSNGDKRFVYRRNGKNSLEGLDPSDLPLYGSEDVKSWVKGQPVLIVEGEKKRDLLKALGLYALATLGQATTPGEDALTILQGFDVVVAPDNDRNNKQFPDCGWRHMDRTARKLVAIGIRPRFIEPDVFPPDGGGLDDYLRLGHGVEDVRQLIATAPIYSGDGANILTQRDEYTFEVDLPAQSGGRVLILAEDVTWERHSLTADLTIQLRSGTTLSRRYGTRIDFRSASGRESAARELGKILGGGGRSAAERSLGENWTEIIMEAGLLIRDRIQTYDPTVDLFDIEEEPAEVRYRIGQLIEENEPTFLFGDGSSCKSYLLMAILLAAGLGGEFCGLPVSSPGPVMLVDYETNRRTVRSRIKRLERGLGMELPPGLFHYFPARGRPLPSLIGVLRKRIQENGIGLVAIDSAAYACDDEPEKSVSATRYLNATQRLGVTTIHIAHINRHGDEDRPFGSVFWHNSARATWFVKRVQDSDRRIARVGLYNKKANNDAVNPLPVAFRLTFEDDAHYGPVTVERENTRHPELTEHDSYISRIRMLLLNNGAKTVPEIASLIGAAADTIRGKLAAHPELFQKLPNPGARSPMWGVRQDD